MTTGGMVAVGAGVVAVGAGVYFLVIRPRQQGVTTIGGALSAAGAAKAPSPVVSTATPAPAFFGSSTASHVERKNEIAPVILSKFGVPLSVGTKVAGIADKLSLSNYAERQVSKIPVVGTAAALPVKVASSVVGKITSLF